MVVGVAKRLVRSLMIAVGAMLVAVSGGCEEAEEFRAATSDAFQSGLTTIITGAIDGAFAVWEPDTTSDSSGTQG